MMSNARNRRALGAALAIVVLALDQASKYWVLHGLDLPNRRVIAVLPPFFDLAMVWNQGVTFGLMQAGSPAGVALLCAFALGITVILFIALSRAEHVLPAACYGAIGGGAIGNVIDRWRFGRVVDFIHLHWAGFDPFPYVFNVGDSAIVIGVGVLLLDSFRPRLPTPPAAA